MASTKKRPNKGFKNRVMRVVESDLFTAVAISSVVLNVLFLASVFVLTSTTTFDRRFYVSSRSKYCQNIDGVIDRAKELGNEKEAVKEWQVTCISEEFSPFYKEALDKFNAQYPN